MNTVDLLFPAAVAIGGFVWVMAARARMLARADAILAMMDNPEERVELLLFQSGFAPGKGREQEARVHEVEKDGWTFLKATAAPFGKTIRSWGGGVNLHFVRERQPDEKPELTAVGAVSSAIAVHAASRRWLSFLR